MLGCPRHQASGKTACAPSIIMCSPVRETRQGMQVKSWLALAWLVNCAHVESGEGRGEATSKRRPLHTTHDARPPAYFRPLPAHTRVRLWYTHRGDTQQHWSKMKKQKDCAFSSFVLMQASTNISRERGTEFHSKLRQSCGQRKDRPLGPAARHRGSCCGAFSRASLCLPQGSWLADLIGWRGKGVPLRNFASPLHQCVCVADSVVYPFQYSRPISLGCTPLSEF